MADDRTERLAAIGEISAEVAHELRNVLQTIAADVFLAKQSPAASAPWLEKIERSTRRAQGIVDDVMALARGEAASALPTDLPEILEVARADLPEADFDDAIASEASRVRAHPGLLARLFHVLYENAIRAAAPGRCAIATRAVIDGDHVVVEVGDDGPGVPAEIAATLFDPLVTGRPEAGGTGLGLALARRIAIAHGGSIALVGEANGPRVEARFRVRLPMV